VGSVEGPRITAVVTKPPPGVKRKPEKVPVEEDENISEDEDWGMFGFLMAKALELDTEIETEEPKDSGWRDAGWREEESDDSSLGSMLAMYEMRRPDGDSDLDSYRSPALVRRLEQIGLTPGMRTMIVSVGNSVLVTQGGSRGRLPNI
jgi:hypothetical protein